MESDEDSDNASDWTQLESVKTFECEYNFLEHSCVYVCTTAFQMRYN